MKIKTIRIENFRSFRDQTISLNRYSCFVGPNGAGKSTILCALNIFFREQDSSATDTSKLCDEDFFSRNTAHPIRVTLTFDDLSEDARTALSDYVRQDELVVTAEAVFDEQQGTAVVRHFGQRPGMTQFRQFFEAMKTGATAARLTEIYDGLRATHEDLPNPRSKDDKANALREYEAQHQDQCVLIPSEDNFYGINSTGKLAPFVQWVYVPAVKDAGQEGLEAKNTAFGRLIARTVRSRTNFDADLETLKQDTLTRYKDLLQRNQASLTEIATSLQTRLTSWAQWEEFRRLGCHIIAVNGKGKLIQPLAIAKELSVPVFVVFDADGDIERVEHRTKHERDNRALLNLLGAVCEPFPAADVIGADHAVWSTNLGRSVKADFGENHTRHVENARVNYAHEGDLEKHDLFIADWLSAARADGHASRTLATLCTAILRFARGDAAA